MHYQCVGVGAGPSNLSLASLLYGKSDLRSIFFDQKSEFSWHDQMLFPGASLQVSLFKDLVTLAEPTNFFSFVSYLHSNGRIYHFLNAQFDSVMRLEFRNYLKWASESNENIHFGEKVLRIDFDGNFVVETTKRRITAENVVVGVGTEPVLPAFCRDQSSETQFHVCEFASKAKASVLAQKHVIVVGGGQSGAEAFLDLISREPRYSPRKVTWISRRENFFPLDDSPFTNDFFMPCHSNHFYEQDKMFRKEFMRRNILGSDGISEHTLRLIYQRIYLLRFFEASGPAVALMPGRAANQIARDGEQWVLSTHRPEGNQREFLHADVVVWATGFRTARMDFLVPLKSRLEREDEEIKIDADFAAVWDGPSNRRIFLLNAARNQRGLPDPNLSLTAWRSQRVIDCIRGVKRTRPQLPSFIEWAPPSWPALAEREIV